MYRDAGISFEAASKLKPDSEKSINNLAISYINQNKFDEALKEIEKVLFIIIRHLNFNHKILGY